MILKRKVQKSNDEHIDEDFPGYPHYPAKDDIMNPQNHTERIEANVENVSQKELKDNGKKKSADDASGK